MKNPRERTTAELQSMLYDSRVAAEERAEARKILEERRDKRLGLVSTTATFGRQRRLWAAAGASCIALGALARPIVERTFDWRTALVAASAVVGGVIAYHLLRGPRRSGAALAGSIGAAVAAVANDATWSALALAGGAAAAAMALFRPRNEACSLTFATAIAKEWVMLAEGEEGPHEIATDGEGGRIEVRLGARWWWPMQYVRIESWSVGSARTLRFTAPGPWALLARSVDPTAEVMRPLMVCEIADPSEVMLVAIDPDGKRTPIPRDAWRYDRERNAILFAGDRAPPASALIEVVLAAEHEVAKP